MQKGWGVVTESVHFVLNGLVICFQQPTICHMNIIWIKNNNNTNNQSCVAIVLKMICLVLLYYIRYDLLLLLWSYCSCVHSDILFSVCMWHFVLGEQSREKFWRRRLCNSGDRPEGINHECQPLTLSVWSLGHTWAWWSLPGNKLQEAASIIHTYKSTVCPLFLEMRLNEGWPYLGSVLLICHWVASLC